MLSTEINEKDKKIEELETEVSVLVKIFKAEKESLEQKLISSEQKSSSLHQKLLLLQQEALQLTMQEGKFCNIYSCLYREIHPHRH